MEGKERKRQDDSGQDRDKGEVRVRVRVKDWVCSSKQNRKTQGMEDTKTQILRNLRLPSVYVHEYGNHPPSIPRGNSLTVRVESPVSGSARLYRRR